MPSRPQSPETCTQTRDTGYRPFVRTACEAPAPLNGLGVSESAACGWLSPQAYPRRWSCGRVAEGGGLLNRYRVVKPYRGFESLRLRQKTAYRLVDARLFICLLQLRTIECTIGFRRHRHHRSHRFCRCADNFFHRRQAVTLQEVPARMSGPSAGLACFG
jgi:hypothetical protein